MRARGERRPASATGSAITLSRCAGAVAALRPRMNARVTIGSSEMNEPSREPWRKVVVNGR
jgi:hypothetical protein